MDGGKACLYLAFLGALGSFLLLAVSLPTDKMVEATLVDSRGAPVGMVNFGILQGSKSLEDGAGSMEVYEFKVIDEYGDDIHPLIVYISLLTLSVGAISALVAAVLTLVNIFKTIPLSSPAGLIGVFFYNILGAVLATIPVLMFTCVVFGSLDADVTGPEERALGYSTGNLVLGYTFWVQVAAIGVLGLNCGAVIFSLTLDTPAGEEKKDGGDDGMPRLTRTIRMEEQL